MLTITTCIFSYRVAGTTSASGQQESEEPHGVASHEYEVVDRGSDGVYSEITAIKTRGKNFNMSECVAYAPTSVRACPKPSNAEVQ